MKRTRYTLLAALAVIPALFSCTEKEQDVPVVKDGYEYQFVIADEVTRAELNDEGVFWETGDKVGLFAGSGESSEAVVNASATPKTIQYTSGSPLPAGTMVRAYYPYSAGNSDQSAVRVTIPAVQTGGAVSAMPMASFPVQILKGQGSNGVIRFLNLGSILDFRVFSPTSKYAGERIRRIQFTASTGAHPVSGEATVNLAGVTHGNEASLALTWPQSAGNPSSVTLKQSADVAESKEAAIAAGHLYMVVAPGTYSGTITVVTNAATYTFPFQDKEFHRNGIKRFNMNLENAEREAWYVKVNSASELVNGGKYLIVYESGSVAFKPIRDGANALEASKNNKQAVTVSNGRIRSSEAVDACQVVFESANSGYYMKAVAADGCYFYPSGSSIAASATAGTSVSLTLNSGVANITAGSSNYFKYSTSSGYFKGSTYNGSRELALYLLDESLQKAQNLQFGASSIMYVLDGQTPPVANVAGPALTGCYTTVTYSSDNPAVATVNPATGMLTIQGTGTAKITATAEADEEFLDASASYTLTVMAEAVFSLENDMVASYLDYVEEHPYSPDDYKVSYVEQFAQNKNSSTRYDLPKPVPVSWTGTSSGNTTVLIYKDAAHAEQEKMANVDYTSSSTAEVYSLIPNREYWYVVLSGTAQIAEGHFRTTGRRRMIKVGESPSGYDYANNCRDFGGLITTDGRTVHYNRIFRGTNMDKTTATQKTYLKESMGIGLDVDLREYTGRNPLDVDLSDQTYNSWTGTNGLTNTTKMKKTISDILQAVNGGKNVYIHCKVGADRTGYVCLLLEAILGVRQDLCDIDYELTSFCYALDGGTYRKRNDTSASHYYYPKGITLLSEQSGNTLQERAIYYLEHTLGIAHADIVAFQEAMLPAAQ